MRANFPAVPFRQRVLIESILSPTRRKVLARTAGHSFATQQVQVQVLLLGVAFNLYRLRMRLAFAPRLP